MKLLTIIGITGLLLAHTAQAQVPVKTLSPDMTKAIDLSVSEVLANTGAPSASVAVVVDGHLAYAQAYGMADIEHHRTATPDMRYGIASNSKSFLAATLYMLADEGKLSLNDKVSKYFPQLTRAKEISLKQLLSHTSGYSDYYAQDYAVPDMLKPTTPQAIIEHWGRQKLDYEPGSDYQYSNTGFVIAALIVEKVTGKPYFTVLKEHIFTPLNMTSVVNNDEAKIGAPDAIPYTRLALGPLIAAKPEGSGWMFGAGELAMTARDLATWDMAILNKRFLSKTVYQGLTTPIMLSTGKSSNYAQGLAVSEVSGHKVLRHGGEVAGFLSYNRLYPDDGLAIVVQVNSDADQAGSTIMDRLVTILTKPEGAQAIIMGLIHDLKDGKIDRSHLTSNFNAYFSDDAVANAQMALNSAGPLRVLTQVASENRGGMTHLTLKAVFAKSVYSINAYVTKEGQIEQCLITPLTN